MSLRSLDESEAEGEMSVHTEAEKGARVQGWADLGEGETDPLIFDRSN